MEKEEEFGCTITMSSSSRSRSHAHNHVMLLPFPAQGHISPMLPFAKRLASKGLKITLVIPTSMSKFLLRAELGEGEGEGEGGSASGGSVTVETIWDGFDGIPSVENCDEFMKQFEAVGSQSLASLIEQYRRSTSGRAAVKCLVYDPTIPWALDIAKRLGIYGAAFFTQSCAVNTIYYHYHQHPVQVQASDIPGMPVLLEIQDLPSFLNPLAGSYQSLKDLVLNQFSNCRKADWRFFNTFHRLEYKVVKWMSSQWPIKTVGPTVPSMFLDKRLEDDKDYGLTIFTPNTEACDSIKWLETKEIGTVVYVSFGSLATLGQEQMEELAWGLKRSNTYFLWVVRASEESKLPAAMDCVGEKGLVVNWCPQLQVLSHQAVGCFVTHCGWNSTLEALSLGVPMVAMPQWTDQTTNAKFIADVWQTGIRVKVNEKGIVTRQEIEQCIREVMEGGRGNELRKNSSQWKELAREAVDEGGSSDKNIDEFIAELESSL